MANLSVVKILSLVLIFELFLSSFASVPGLETQLQTQSNSRKDGQLPKRKVNYVSLQCALYKENGLVICHAILDFIFLFTCYFYLHAEISLPFGRGGCYEKRKAVGHCMQMSIHICSSVWVSN